MFHVKHLCVVIKTWMGYVNGCDTMWLLVFCVVYLKKDVSRETSYFFAISALR